VRQDGRGESRLASAILLGFAEIRSGERNDLSELPRTPVPRGQPVRIVRGVRQQAAPRRPSSNTSVAASVDGARYLCSYYNILVQLRAERGVASCGGLQPLPQEAGAPPARHYDLAARSSL